MKNLKLPCMMVFFSLALLSMSIGCGNGDWPVGSNLMGGSVQGTALNLKGTVSFLAGSGYTDINGTGNKASFDAPFAVTTDGTNLYVADYGAGTVRQIVISSGVVTTLATGFSEPVGITTDGTNLYVPDEGSKKIYKVVISSGAVSTLTTLTGRVYSVTTDNTNLYTVDFDNCVVNKIVIASGATSAVAGVSGTCTTGDGSLTTATFNTPVGITTDGTYLYVTEWEGHVVRKIDVKGNQVSTLAGKAGVSGSGDGQGSAALFNFPYGISTDGTNLYVADSGNHKIRAIVISSGEVSSITSAPYFDTPYGITNTSSGVYVADYGNYTILAVQ
jgi:hypothetical protein